MDTAKYLRKRYDDKHYNCLHFVAEGWLELTGTDLFRALSNLLGIAETHEPISRATYRAFQTLPVPIDPCIVLMQAPYERPHVGIYLRGRVLHIHKNGVEHTDLEVASRQFKKVRFITCRSN